MGKSIYSKAFVFLFLVFILSVSLASARDNYDYYGLNPDDNVYTFNPGNSNDNSYENSYAYNHRSVTRDSYVTKSFVKDNPWNGGNVRVVRRAGYSDNVYGSGDSCSNHYNWYDCSGYPSTNYRYREVYHPYSWDSAYGEDEYTAQYYYQVHFDSDLGYYNWRY